ncbi:hypothetical protein BDV59DRAFT_210363 [Aspergillus ambiguus]|uniref:uncharacterized protein n=1 Tax=Aspergillus ambiguus TaxID=176160 RepID=UPI003CCDFB54
MTLSNGNSLPLTAYTVGWVCVTGPEHDAARVLLDERHETPDIENGFIYLVGRMGEHNVVITSPPSAGRSPATAAATNLIRTFPEIRFVLMVGVGGGATKAPSRAGSLNPAEDIFLGDVVVSEPHGDHGGVLQYDMGVQYPGGYQIRSHLNKPGTLLTQAAQTLRRDHGFREGNMHSYIQQAMRDLEGIGRTEFRCPGPEHDRLFEPGYYHRGTDTEGYCQGCDTAQLVRRTRRDAPCVYYGLIGSADTIMRDGHLRDRMRQSHNVLCFEMEAAGLMDSFPCLVIRGISDYADTHKNDLWQPYAALTAAAYAKDLLSVIKARGVQQAELASKLLGDMNTVKIGVTELHSKLEERERCEIINWLTPLDFQAEQQRLFDNCVSSGQHVIESEVFQRWVMGAPWQLRCYGPAGVGKTHFCALIVDHLKQTFSRTSSQRPVIYIYLSDEKDKRDSQTPENVLGSLVKQLIVFNNPVRIPSDLQEAFKNKLPREVVLKRTFEELLGAYERTYLVVDGFYPTPDVLQILKDYPLELIRKGVPLSLLTTSPGYRQAACVIDCDVCKKQDLRIFFNCHCNDNDFDLCLTCKVEGISCPNSHSGQETYDTVRVELCPTEEEIASSPGPGRWDKRIHPEPSFKTSRVARYLCEKPELHKKIAKTIAEKAQGNFLIAQYWLEGLLDASKIQFDWDSLLARIEYMPYELLKDYCDRKIECVKNYNRGQALAFKVFRLLMAHALALESDSWLDEVNLEHRVSILRATNGLITIDKADDPNSIVRFFHGALKKVLGESDLDPSLKLAESKMASLCLTYLKHEHFTEHSADLARYPFLHYTLQHWGDHVRRARDRHDYTIQDEAFGFLNDPDNVKAVAREAGKVLPPNWIHDGISAIHLCAWFGLSEIVKKLARDGHSITEPDSKHGRTPLQYACRQGHLDTVKALLELNVLPSKAAIMDAVYGFPGLDRDEKQRVEIAKVLLSGRTLNSAINACGTTILMFGIINGYYDFVDTLLQDQSIDVNAIDGNGRTALWLAVGSQPANLVPLKTDLSDGILGLLLRKGADPNIPCLKTRRSVLAHAISSKRSAAVNALLKSEGRRVSSSPRANSSIDLSAGDTLEDCLPGLENRAMDNACNRRRRLSVIEKHDTRGAKRVKI